MPGAPTFHWGQSTVTVAQGETVTVTSTSMFQDFMSYSVGDTSIATATPNSEWTSWTIQGVSPGTTTVIIHQAEIDPGPLTITVTAGDDQNFLNERGLMHFWNNIDNVKQDKLKAGTNITISADNTISADLETELSQYVTAEDIASTSALTPPVQTNMIADGAVSNAKIDWSSTSRPIYYRGTDWARSWTFNYDAYSPQIIFVAWESSVAMFARIWDKIYKVFQDGSHTVTSSINTTNHTWTLSTSNTGVINVLELKNTKTGE